MGNQVYVALKFFFEEKNRIYESFHGLFPCFQKQVKISFLFQETVMCTLSDMQPLDLQNLDGFAKEIIVAL